jgi:hypothetical protein
LPHCKTFLWRSNNNGPSIFINTVNLRSVAVFWCLRFFGWFFTKIAIFKPILIFLFVIKTRKQPLHFFRGYLIKTVARWYICGQKIPTLVYFWMPWNGKFHGHFAIYNTICSIYVMAIWYILWSFEHLLLFWYIASRKIWQNPADQLHPSIEIREVTSSRRNSQKR